MRKRIELSREGAESVESTTTKKDQVESTTETNEMSRQQQQTELRISVGA